MALSNTPYWPLMKDNIISSDLAAVRAFLNEEDIILTQSKNVAAFEREWSEWLGVKHSVFVNSGSSANEISMAIIREMFGEGEVIVPPLTWVSDIAAVLFSGLTPVFCDIDQASLGLNTEQVLNRLCEKTRAVFLTHILGYDGLTDKLLAELADRNIALVEDVCESHGATHKGKKLGSFGLISNFSFYYAHHMSTIEGGMICTDSDEVYELSRMMRSHGMVREAKSDLIKSRYKSEYPDLNPDFIFAFPSHNMRSTEINAVIGREQLKRLDGNNTKRRANLSLFLQNLDSRRFFVEFPLEGSSNYAFTLVLREADSELMSALMDTLRAEGIEFRRGLSGGGNQLRQPYLRKSFGDLYKEFPVTDHVHFYGMYIGNYPDLESERILELCNILNSVGV